MYVVTVNNKVVYRGTREACAVRAARESQAWGPLYVVRIERRTS